MQNILNNCKTLSKTGPILSLLILTLSCQSKKEFQSKVAIDLAQIN